MGEASRHLNFTRPKENAETFLPTVALPNEAVN
jgi:hypothetical protein